MKRGSATPPQQSHTVITSNSNNYASNQRQKYRDMRAQSSQHSVFEQEMSQRGEQVTVERLYARVQSLEQQLDRGGVMEQHMTTTRLTMMEAQIKAQSSMIHHMENKFSSQLRSIADQLGDLSSLAAALRHGHAMGISGSNNNSLISKEDKIDNNEMNTLNPVHFPHRSQARGAMSSFTPLVTTPPCGNSPHAATRMISDTATPLSPAYQKHNGFSSNRSGISTTNLKHSESDFAHNDRSPHGSGSDIGHIIHQCNSFLHALHIEFEKLRGVIIEFPLSHKQLQQFQGSVVSRLLNILDKWGKEYQSTMEQRTTDIRSSTRDQIITLRNATEQRLKTIDAQISQLQSMNNTGTNSGFPSTNNFASRLINDHNDRMNAFDKQLHKQTSYISQLEQTNERLLTRMAQMEHNFNHKFGEMRKYINSELENQQQLISTKLSKLNQIFSKPVTIDTSQHSGASTPRPASQGPALTLTNHQELYRESNQTGTKIKIPVTQDEVVEAPDEYFEALGHEPRVNDVVQYLELQRQGRSSRSLTSPDVQRNDTHENNVNTIPTVSQKNHSLNEQHSSNVSDIVNHSVSSFNNHTTVSTLTSSAHIATFSGITQDTSHSNKLPRSPLPDPSVAEAKHRQNKSNLDTFIRRSYAAIQPSSDYDTNDPTVYNPVNAIANVSRRESGITRLSNGHTDVSHPRQSTLDHDLDLVDIDDLDDNLDDDQRNQASVQNNVQTTNKHSTVTNSSMSVSLNSATMDLSTSQNTNLFSPMRNNSEAKNYEGFSSKQDLENGSSKSISESRASQIPPSSNTIHTRIETRATGSNQPQMYSANMNETIAKEEDVKSNPLLHGNSQESSAQEDPADQVSPVTKVDETQFDEDEKPSNDPQERLKQLKRRLAANKAREEARVSMMDEEERTEYERSKAQKEAHEARKGNMLRNQFSAYSARGAGIIRGRGRGRR